MATKGGPTRQGLSMWKSDGRPEHLREACHASLRRLGIDWIDLYQLHAVDPGVPIEESLGALVVLQQEGKIKHLGVCNVTVSELERARAVATIASAQNRFNALDRTSDALLEMCERIGIVFIPWAPLGGGRLADSRGDVARVARRLGATRTQVVLAWLLYRLASALPIPGTRSVEHLEENLAASSVSLGPDDLVALERPVKLGLSPRHLARELRARARRLSTTLHVS